MNTKVSQANVATCLRCGEFFNHRLVANLLLSAFVKKKIENGSTFTEVIGKSRVSCFVDSHGSKLFKVAM